METWLRNQCLNRSHSFKFSVKSLFAKKNKEESFLIEDGFKQLREEEKHPEKIWRRLSLHSFRKRREKKQEEKSKPMIPAVLRTYDKQNKDAGWL